MKQIAFLTPYKHLPNFKKIVESKYECLDLSNLSELEQKNNIHNSDYLFSAPNYQKFEITDDFIKDTPITMIISPSTGTNHINVSIPTISIKNDKVLENIWSTAEHNLYLMLTLPRNIGNIVELHEKTLGILGYGRLGKMIEHICKPIFKNIYTSDIDYTDNKFFNETDFLSINVDLRDENIGMVNSNYISKFKKEIYIINTSRGELVNELDISTLINEDKIKGYATDVIQNEHSIQNSSLLLTQSNKIIITPHVGGTALESQEKAYSRVIKKISISNSEEETFEFLRKSTNYNLYKSLLGSDGKYFSAIHHIIINKPKLILEYGGGRSTLILSTLLEELNYGGKIVAFEENKKFYDYHNSDGSNKYNNIVYVEDAIVDGKFFTYTHDLEPYKDVEFIIIDGPDERVTKTGVTLNLELFVDYIGKEIPYFMDGRGENIIYYKNTKQYKLEVDDVKKYKTHALK
jgi:lactate dehydrogenase-like 2-hydroxyacid dehydrogenase|tara:strand:+ start:8735 stop:10123 length:1389 start_codon:yes stop_codon:yes gene_type:complete